MERKSVVTFCIHYGCPEYLVVWLVQHCVQQSPLVEWDALLALALLAALVLARELIVGHVRLAKHITHRASQRSSKYDLFLNS